MNVRTEALIDAALRRSPAQPLFRWKASRRLAVLAYHGVDDPKRFVKHLDHIQRTSSVVMLSEVLDAFEGRRSLPRRALLVTFDDGHRSVLDVAMPLLRDRGIPAVAFVIAGLVDTKQPFWWSEVIDLATQGGFVRGMPQLTPQDLVRALKRLPNDDRIDAIDQLRVTARLAAAPAPQLTAEDLRVLEASGIVVGNHTWSHPCLAQCTNEVRRREIERSHQRLTSMLGHPPVAFAYPDGGYDPLVAKVLKELGYRAAFLFDHRLSSPHPDDPFAVSRLRVNSYTTKDRFHTIASGLHPAVLRRRGGA
jgi:peptidoglycan/xylan/chitin deacetylase (PgdA/CDA1 family)